MEEKAKNDGIKVKHDLSKIRKFVLDTNFFISGFEKKPSDFQLFLQIIYDLGLEIYVSNHILQELRWYLRRRIKPPIQVKQISMKKIRNLRTELTKRNIQTPQIVDISNIVAADEVKGVVISSDLQLVRACEKLSIPVLTSSSFIFFLKNACSRDKQTTFLEELYDTILSDEIRHSVDMQQFFDPVTRIKKIQEHALNVLENFTKKPQKIEHTKAEHFHAIQEENKLIDLMNEIEFEFTNYLEQLKIGNLEELKVELGDIYSALADLSLELRIALKDKESYTEELAIRLRARILYLLSIVEFTLLDFQSLNGYMNLLTELSTIFPSLVSDIYMDLHFLRMAYLLITNQYERLASYYSAKFLILCKTENRDDLFGLIRAVILASTIIESGLIDKKASSDGKDEIALLIQLGYIFLQLQQNEHALLILLQAHYLAVNIKEKILAKDSLELFVILHYSIKEKCTEEIEQGIDDLKNLGVFEVPNITRARKKELQDLITQEYLPVGTVRSELQEWFYIYHYTKKEIDGETYSIILLKNPYFTPNVALMTKATLPIRDVSPGRQMRIYDGNIKVSLPEAFDSIDDHKIDLILQVDEKESKFIFRGSFGMKILI